MDMRCPNCGVARKGIHICHVTPINRDRDLIEQGRSEVRAHVAELHKRVDHLGDGEFFDCNHCDIEWPCPTAIAAGIEEDA